MNIDTTLWFSDCQNVEAKIKIDCFSTDKNGSKNYTIDINGSTVWLYGVTPKQRKMLRQVFSNKAK